MELNRGAIMKAYAYSKTGPAEEVFQIQEVHLPEPGPGEICVRMQWTGVNPSDVKRTYSVGDTFSKSSA